MKFLECLLLVAAAFTCGQLLDAADPQGPSSSPTAPPVPTSPPTPQTTSQTTTVAPESSSSTTVAPKVLNCPQPCSCTQTVVNCGDRQLTQMPKMDLRNSPFRTLIFKNNSISSVDFRQLGGADIAKLDLSNNQIRTIWPPTAKKASEVGALKHLDLSANQIDSLGNFSVWKMPNLLSLDLSSNPLTEIEATTFVLKPKITVLRLKDLANLKSIDERALAPLGGLENLDLSKSLRRIAHLPDQLFANSSMIDVLLLANNSLIEVPAALRSTSSISALVLNGNSMTSLRQSDFINRTNLLHLEIRHCSKLTRIDPYTFSEMPSLKSLVITDNERLGEISSHAFERQENRGETVLKLFDLSNNNLTTLSSEMPDLKWVELHLARNPWDCTCALKWMLAPPILGWEPLHCATPSKFRDMEISQVLPTIECQPEESLMQRFVLIVFLLFLVVLTVAVFVQRADICRRLQWRDQYGTIYYTKASFPAEQV